MVCIMRSLSLLENTVPSQSRVGLKKLKMVKFAKNKYPSRINTLDTN